MLPVRYCLFGTIVAFGLTGVAGQAVASDDGYQNVVSSVLGAVGLLKPDATPDIDYRERAPLVLPPKMDLIKPVPTGAARTAAWPKDPDVLKRRRAEEAARAPSENMLGNPNDLLSKDELLKGRTAAIPESSVRASNCGNNGNNRNCLVVNPDELRAEGDRARESGAGDTKKQKVAGEEPDRLFLTQPPKGYLKTTKTVKATTEAPVEKLDEARPSSALVYRPKNDDE